MPPERMSSTRTGGPTGRRRAAEAAGAGVRGVGPDRAEVADPLSRGGRVRLGGSVEPPRTSPGRTPARLQLAAKALRRQYWTYGQLAAALAVSARTVGRVLRR